MALPSNIAIWTLPRAGSTSMLLGIRDAMRHNGYDRTTQLWEATGAWGILRMNSQRQLGNTIDFSRLMDNDTELDVDFRHWTIGPKGILKSVEETGDPRTEIDNRVNIMYEGNWLNNVVFKNMRWSPESLSRNTLNEDFDRALLSSPASFHHVILWRRNVFDWLCSRFVFTRIGMSHGTYHWDGESKIGDPDRFKKGRHKRIAMSVLGEFAKTFDIIPKERAVMVETTAINTITEFAWPDGTVLPIHNNAFRQESGKMVYINDATGKRVQPQDLMHPDIIGMFRELETKVNERLNWQELDKNSGFIYHG